MILDTMHAKHFGSVDSLKVSLGIIIGVIFQDLSEKVVFPPSHCGLLDMSMTMKLI